MDWSESICRKRKCEFGDDPVLYSPQVGIVFDEDLSLEFEKIPQLKLRVNHL